MTYMHQKTTFPSFSSRHKRGLLSIVSIVVIALFIILILKLGSDPHNTLHFPSLGYLRTVNVKAYWDENHLNETKEISWGTVYPGSSFNSTIFLQSISNVRTRLELVTGNWTFLDSHGTIVLGPVNETSYMDLTWNYVDTNVNPEETVKITLTLNATNSSEFVSFLVNNDVQGFNVDIDICAFVNT